MLCLKKIYRNDILQLALVLSFLRLDLSVYFNPGVQIRSNISIGWRGDYHSTDSYPKNLDTILLNYERQLFEDLNSLGRYSSVRAVPQNYDISAYLLNVERQSIAESLLGEQALNAQDSGVENDDVELSTEDNVESHEELNSFEELEPGPNSSSSSDLFHLSQLPDDVPKNFLETDSDSYLDEDGDDFLKSGSMFFADSELIRDSFDVLKDIEHDIKSEISDAKNETKLEKIKEENATSLEENIEEEALLNEFASISIDGNFPGELTREDMDLIEVLWKQDVDLGFSLDTEDIKLDPSEFQHDVKNQTKSDVEAKNGEGLGENSEYDDKVKHFDTECLKTEELQDDEDNQSELDDPWAGLQYTIDTETGEYVLKGGLRSNLPSGPCDNSLPGIPLEDLGTLPLSLPDLLFEEPLHLNALDDECSQELYDSERRRESPLLDVLGSGDSSASVVSSASVLKDVASDEDDILAMLQTAQFHSTHPHAFQSHMPYVRMNEQRWQDVAGFLSDGTGASAVLPGSSHHAHAAAFSAHAAHHAVAALQHLGHPHHMHGHPSHVTGTYGSDSRGLLTHNVSLASPMATEPHGISHFANINGTNLGSAVATSINLTNTTEMMNETGAAGAYKMENNPHDIMYFPNSSSEIGNATDGFFNSILNEEDLQLMDMAMSEGMYPMRMLDGGGGGGIGNGTMTNTSRMDMAAASERMDASSDSAVSSMGSERVPSLSDNEWGDATSDSGHNADHSGHYALDHTNKYRPYDYSYSRQQTNNLLGSDTRRMSPVAQKKHHMFGKRFFQDQTTNPPAAIKYEYNNISGLNSVDIRSGQPIGGSSRPKMNDLKFPCSMEPSGHIHSGRSVLDHIHHNHTYGLPPESTGTMQRPVFRDKTKGGKCEEETHLTRDEKRARALNVPMSVDDIINLPMDEFNERLSKFDLSEPQLSLIRDIRRRGKNKVAAQNCRKRKLDQILNLAGEVKDMRDKKHCLLSEREFMISELQRVKEKFSQLYRHVFRHLRDHEGNLYSPNLYSLQQSADGTVIIVPKGNATEPKDPHKKPQP